MSCDEDEMPRVFKPGVPAMTFLLDEHVRELWPQPEPEETDDDQT